MWGTMNLSVAGPLAMQKRGFHGISHNFNLGNLHSNKLFTNNAIGRNIHGKTHITDIRSVNEDVTTPNSSSILENIKKIKPEIMKTEPIEEEVTSCKTVNKNSLKPRRRKFTCKKNKDSIDLTTNNSMEIEDDNIITDTQTCSIFPQPLILEDFLSENLKLHEMEISENSPKPPIAFSITPPKNCEKFMNRERQMSTCESEDSFVVFESGSEDELNFSDNNISSEDSDSDESDSCSSCSDSDSGESVVPTKRVRFADDEDLCEVHPMVQWAFAYQAARKGPWETYARDRERFKNRIRKTENILTPIFEEKHRDRIYEDRFDITE